MHPERSPQLAASTAEVGSLSLSPAGTLVAYRTGGEIVIDDLDRNDSRRIAIEAREVVALDDAVLALVFDTDWRLIRIDPARGDVTCELALPVRGNELALRVRRADACSVVVSGDRQLLVHIESTQLEPTSIDMAYGQGILLTADAWIESGPAGLLLRRPSGVRCLEPARATHLVQGAALLDGRLAAIQLAGGGGHRLVVVDLESGRVKHRFQLRGIAHVGLVERRGHAVLARDHDALTILDLVEGKPVRDLHIGAIEGIACDCEGRRLVANVGGRIITMPYPVHLVAPSLPEPLAKPVESAHSDTPEPTPRPVEHRHSNTPAVAPVEPEPSSAHAHADAPVVPEQAQAPATREPEPELPTAPLERLAPRAVMPPLSDDDRARYLHDLLALVVSRCELADRVRHTPDEEEEEEKELDLELSRAHIAEIRAQWSQRWSRPDAPHRLLADDLGLSERAVDILLFVAAPQVWGELGDLYRSVGGPETGRGVCNELLVAQLLDASPVERTEIARELAPDAPLVRSGAIVSGDGIPPFAPLHADPAVVARLRGEPVTTLPDGVTMENAAVALEDVVAPRRQLAALVAALVPRSSAPVRIVLHGASGSGRRTLARALAARAGRAIGDVAVPADGDAAVLARRLQQCVVRGWLPCVDVTAICDDSPVHAAVRSVLDRHHGPLFVRCDLGALPPLSPGYLALDLPAPSLTVRRDLWHATTTRRGLRADADALATRFTVGPGVITRVVESVAETSPREGDATAALVQGLRQYRDARIGRVATRVEHLPDWSQLVAPDEIVDTLREMVARVKHRRVTLEEWGFSRIASTARGTTALFQGPPGTGKTLAAGVVANALGCELYRIDLSRIVSKWIGETEKNLGTLFDAAEGGDTVLLFDEADALFAKRSEVKSSNDRHANTTVDYLLQRLDAFGGIAILTTNYGASIDAAFRRRMSFRVCFPLPDAAERERLWRAHLPAACPVEGNLALGDLAERYEMSGGYIRNAMLRAAFLAAAEGRALSTHLIERAVRAEYRDQGRLHHGRLE